MGVEYPCILIGVDPGVTTGIAVMGLTEKTSELLETYQWEEPDTVWRQIRDLAHTWQAKGFSVTLVVEQFDKRPGVISPDFTPKYVNRDIENNILDVPIVWQIPAQAKTLVPQGKKGQQDALKRFGWYQTAHRHANDGIRHCIVYAVEKLRHRPTVDKGWKRT